MANLQHKGAGAESPPTLFAQIMALYGCVLQGPKCQGSGCSQKFKLHCRVGTLAEIREFKHLQEFAIDGKQE